MAGGLAGLLDDIAALAKVAAASIDDVGAAAGRASAKAAGVVVDDTAVTPAYVRGLAAERELLGGLRYVYETARMATSASPSLATGKPPTTAAVVSFGVGDTIVQMRLL